MLTRQQRIIFLIPLALVVIPFVIWPALLGLATSFTNYVPFKRITLSFVGFANYLSILRDPEFQISVRNIAVFTIGTVAIELLLGMTIAYALRKAFRGRSLIRVILLLPWLVSPIANGVMWHFLFNTDNGILNVWPVSIGLPQLPYPLNPGYALMATMAVDIWRKAPLVTFLILPGLLAIPTAQWEHAEIEGLPFVARLRHIILPHVRLLILTITLLLVGDSIGTSESILILTGGGPVSETMTPGLYSFQRAFRIFDWQTGAVSAWLIALAVVLIGVCYVILSRREVSA
jgi:multiple sugar transport system permease protein